MKKNELARISEEFNLRPNKKFGQNFLIDESITEKLVNLLDIREDDRVLEIGPGLGALTGKILERCSHLTAVEIDSGICRYLADRYGTHPGFTLVHGDFLKTGLEDIFTRVVSNLPYYCATEILFTIAGGLSAPDVYVMVQKEMADRIMSPPGSKIYGALSVTLGYYYKTRILLNLGSEIFHPRPEVDSAFLHLARREGGKLDKGQLELFHLLVKSAFWGRRKTLLKTLTESPHVRFDRDLARDLLDRAGISQSIRGEELSTEDFMKLAVLFSSPPQN